MRSFDPKRLAPAGRGAAGAGVEEEDQVDESAAMAAAVEAELAALEAAPQEAPPSEVELPARQLPDLTMLAPGEESLPEPAAADPTFDGPLQVPFPDRSEDGYHCELSRFLMLWTRRNAVEGRIANREAVLKLGQAVLGYEAPEGEVRLPLFEDAQMEACLRRRQHVINPSRLLSLCLGTGRAVALRGEPALSEGQARQVLARLHPERLGQSALEVVHEPFVQFNYQVTLRYYRKEERVFSLVYGADRELPAGALEALLSPERWLEAVAADPAARGARAAAIERLEATARSEVARKSRERQAVIQREIDEDVRENIKILDDYYQEKAKELEDEKRAVYFHLYYFEKEEAIDKQLTKMKREKEERARAMERFWDVRVDTRLLSLGYFEVPFWRAVDPASEDLAVDALAGVAYYRDGGYWLTEQE